MKRAVHKVWACIVTCGEPFPRVHTRGRPEKRVPVITRDVHTQTDIVPVSELTVPVSEADVPVKKHVCTQTDLSDIFEPRPRLPSLSVSSNRAEPSQSVQQDEYLVVNQA